MVPSSCLLVLLFWSGDGCSHHVAYLELLRESWLARRPVTLAFGGSLEEAESLRGCLLDRLKVGKLVGYKAAFTGQKARERFGLTEPLLGFLHEGMLLDETRSVPYGFATTPMIELDLLARIGDGAVNRATSAEEAMKHVDALLPFIELPDLVFGREVALNQAHLVLANAGARLGVYGRPIPWQQSAYQALGNIRAQLLGADQQLLAEGNTAVLMGHPANAVLWIRDEVVKRGGKLKKGDLLSLGSISMPFPLKFSGAVTARYYGLGGQTVDLNINIESEP